jgi:hypothetical protein
MFRTTLSSTYSLHAMSKKKTSTLILSLRFFLLFLLGMVLSCGGQQEREFQDKANLPPVISSVTISPGNPNKESNLSLSVQNQNPSRGPVTFRYQWIKNDEQIPGENEIMLKSGNFRKGDLIRAKVTPSNGKADGSSVLSPAVKILNSPPVIQEVWIEPKVARVTDPLKAVVKGSDPDGDSISYVYKWEKNGVVLSGENTDTLEPNRFKKRDSITVTVTPSDGETFGKPKKSEAVAILNSPPTITSSPPTAPEGRIYTYRVTANDPDNDAITFSLKTAPKGMEIDKETGMIRWEIEKRDQGPQLIEIEASDPEGAKSFQRFTLSFEPK